MRAYKLFAAALLALLSLPPTAATAEDRTIALGKNGALYSVVAGRHGDLFPNGPAAVADNPALAMDIVRAGQPNRRLLVPGTDDPAVEATPYLLYQDSLDTAVVVWESRLRDIHSRLYLACLRDDTWSPLIDLQSDFWSWKSSPRIAITTESYQIADASGVSSTHQRTIIHTLWWEDAGAGERTVYSPVVFVDGKYIGWNPVQVLDALDTAAGPAPFAIASALSSSPSVRPGSEANSLVLSFVNPRTGRLLTIDVEVLPVALTDLAFRLRTYLLGLDPRDAGSLQSIADRARAHILIGGSKNFNKKYLRSLANEVRQRILEMPAAGSGITAIADVSRAHILIGGVEIGHPTLGDDVGITSMEIPAEGPDGEETETSPVAIVQLRQVVSILAPRIGGGPTTILTSADGRRNLIAWEEAGEIRYRENYGGPWTATQALIPGAGLSRERVYEILQQRVSAN